MTTQTQGERRGPDGFVYPGDTIWGDFVDGASVGDKHRRGADRAARFGNSALAGVLGKEAKHYGVSPNQDQPADSQGGEGDSSESSATSHEL